MASRRFGFLTIYWALSRRPWLVVGVAAALGLLGAYLSSQLKLRTAFSELLPDDDPGVVAMHKTQNRMGDLSLLLVGIRSPDRAANERYAAALTAKLRALPPAVCDIATYHVRDIIKFIDQNRWLYASETDLAEMRDRIKREIHRRKNPLLIDLDDSDDDDKALEKRVRGSSSFEGRFPDGLFTSAGSQTIWVVALPPGGIMVERAGVGLLEATQDFIRANPPSSYHPQMDVQPTGPVVTPLRNQEALKRDLTWVATLCGVLIPLSIGLYFRSLRAVFFITIPAVLAVILAYAVASVAFGYLTLMTSFLVSFVMGNGTNYAIVLMARYQEERRHGMAAGAASDLACAALWRSTGVAALASAISYASLMVTDFRGFSQFGLIGAAGCLFAWCMTFLVMPALLRLFDGGPPTPTPIGTKGGMMMRIGRLVEGRPRAVLLVGAVATVVMVAGTARFGRDAFEYDFRKLSARGIPDARLQRFDSEVDALFGRWPQPWVVVADRPEDVEPLRATIRQQDAALPGADVIARILSIHDLLPGTPEVQQRKLEILGQIRKAIDDPALEALEDDKRRELERLRPPPTLRVQNPHDLPPLARRSFTEADGTIGRVLLVYPPDQGISVYDGRDLLRIASVMHRLHLPDGRHLDTSGPPVIFSAMIRSILHDGPRATFASLAAVMLLVLLRVRPFKAAFFVIGGLITGVLWMTGIAGLLEVKITFLNFIALPFIFGVGVEYAIHVVGEYKEHGSISRTVISAGGPVALCSWSAIVGYGSLLVASNGALQGLGMIATLGETTCLLAAVVLTPAALAWAGFQARGGLTRG